VSIFYEDGTEKKFDTKSKAAVAKDIVASIMELINK
jgi:hypothetical protein